MADFQALLDHIKELGCVKNNFKQDKGLASSGPETKGAERQRRRLRCRRISMQGAGNVIKELLNHTKGQEGLMDLSEQEKGPALSQPEGTSEDIKAMIVMGGKRAQKEHGSAP